MFNRHQPVSFKILSETAAPPIQPTNPAHQFNGEKYNPTNPAH